METREKRGITKYVNSIHGDYVTLTQNNSLIQWQDNTVNKTIAVFIPSSRMLCGKMIHNSN